MTNQSWDNTWEEIFSTQEWGKYPPEELVRFIARNYYKRANRNEVKILDLGCGTGAATWFMAREGFHTFGIDGSPTAIKLAKERFEKEGLTGEFRVGDLVELPYTDEEFEVVTDIASIQHNTPANIVRILSEIQRVLQPKGRFFGMMIAEDTSLSNWPGTIHFFTRAEIEDLFKGFTSVVIDHVERTREGTTKQAFWIVQATK